MEGAKAASLNLELTSKVVQPRPVEPQIEDLIKGKGQELIEDNDIL